MSPIQNIFYLFKKDVTIEWRQKSTIASMFVYVISTVFTIYLSLKGSLEPEVWMAIYWIVLLFVVVNLTIRSFTEEAGRQFYYLRSIAQSGEIIAAKMLYNALYFIVLSGLTLAILSLFFGFPVENGQRFLAVAVLGSIGLANMFTLLAAITSRIKNVALIAVLGFPIVIPLLLISIKLSAKAMDNFFAIGFVKELLILALLDVIIIMLSLILFTYLWRD